MKIFHYALGFPPYRTGGLTKFCLDLMKEQLKEGHSVGLLWPGKTLLFSKKTSIREKNAENGIRSFEIINALPIPYDEGIKNVSLFTALGDEAVYHAFLNKEKPDVIHIHTFMGLHKSLISASKALGIRLCFTTHDFFPICPVLSLFRNGKICSNAETCENCGRCCKDALPDWKLFLLQAPLYRWLKDSALVKKLRGRHRKSFYGRDTETENNGAAAEAEIYRKLRKHYLEMLREMDVIHCNSRLTQSVYERFLQKAEYRWIPITHGDIADHRRRKQFREDKLRFTYMGSAGSGKGWNLLSESLKKLWNIRKDFTLNVFFDLDNPPEYVLVHERFSYDEQEKIFDNTDLLLAPSLHYETFGYTVAEALSYAVPVLITENVGAKDILPGNGGMIISLDSENSLFEALKEIDAEKLQRMNRVLLEEYRIYTEDEMAAGIMKECYCRN